MKTLCSAAAFRAARDNADLALATALALEIVQNENPIFGVIRGSRADVEGTDDGSDDDQSRRRTANG